MRPISAKYTPLKWEGGEEVPDVANSRIVKIIKIVEPAQILTQAYEAVFIDADGKLELATINRFSECALITVRTIRRKIKFRKHQ